MSEFTFKLPYLGEGTVQAEIAEWMVKVGDVVAEEDPICAMLTDKAAVELTAPVSGRVTAVAGVEGDMVTVDAPLIVFETHAAASSTEAADPSTAAATAGAEAHPAKAHLVSADVDGALLAELFTHEGVGTMVTRQSVESLRPASIDDVGGILSLIEPLEEAGVLVHRPRELLEQEIERFFIDELDGRIVGYVALYPFTEIAAGEMACLAVHPEFRGSGRGEALMAAVEDVAREAGMQQLYVLTTRTAHWFLERGFSQASPEDLPAKRKELYNWQRRSKIFIKTL